MTKKKEQDDFDTVHDLALLEKAREQFRAGSLASEDANEPRPVPSRVPMATSDLPAVFLPSLGQEASIPNTRSSTDALIEGVRQPAEEASSPFGERYQVLSTLGDGGMGVVYKVHDTQLNEDVALKLLRPEILHHPGMLERFKREVKLARRVTHHHVARTYDLGQYGTNYYLTMEYIEGESLANLLDRKGLLPLQRALAISIAMAQGLFAAHQVHVIHRDLKPANVLLAQDGRVLLSDFGIAGIDFRQQAQDSTGSPLGTPAYMSPEQLQGRHDIDFRADIYSLGLIVYELLGGARAWSEENPFSLIFQRLSGEKAPPLAELAPSLPAGLTDLVTQMMAWEREDRPADAQVIASQFAQYLAQSGADVSDLGIAFSTGHYPAVLSTGLPPFSTTSSTLARWQRIASKVSQSQPLGDKRLAVIPFRSAPEDSFLTEGLTEDLSDLLSMLSGVRVRPMRLMRGLDVHSMSIKELAETVQADVLIEGSIRRQGDLLHIPVRLLSAEGEYQIWARRFQCTTGEIFGLSEELAAAVAEALTLEANPHARLTTTDPEAIECYLRARQEQRLHWHGDLSGAAALYQQALRKAPGDPMLLVGAAVTYARKSFSFGASAEEEREVARGLVDQAIAANPSRGEPLYALGLLSYYDISQTSEAIDALCTALERLPSLPQANELLSRILIEIGPLQEGIILGVRALALDPSLLNVRWDLMRAYALSGDWAQADVLGDLPVAHEQERRIRAVVRVRLDLWRGVSRWGDEELPLPTLDSAVNAGIHVLFSVRHTRQLPNDFFRLMELWMSVQGSHRWQLALMQPLAEVLAYTGAYEQCMDVLETVIARGILDLMWLRHCPLFDPLRKQADFQGLLRQLEARVQAIHAGASSASVA